MQKKKSLKSQTYFILTTNNLYLDLGNGSKMAE